MLLYNTNHILNFNYNEVKVVLDKYQTNTIDFILINFYKKNKFIQRLEASHF